MTRVGRREPETADEVIAALGLQPHPREGGWFVETWRDARPVDVPGVRSSHLHTAIYYLLSPTSTSAMHRLPGDEVFHHYAGDPVEMTLLFPDGRHAHVTLGPDLAAGERPQVVVPGGTWQGSLLREGGRYALLGCTMAPGFAYEDYEDGDVDALARAWPAAAEAIAARAPR
jgi:predicted cupin superfamily sugar epimerase